MLINSSYFIGEINIPNAHYGDVASIIDYFINIHEPEYLEKALGYELFKLFEAGIAVVSPQQRFLDILLGKEFTSYDGRKKKWDGLVSLTASMPGITVNLSSDNDFFFTIGVTPGAPAAGTDTYDNTALADLQYRVVQRSIGPLEFGVDIDRVSTGGFKFRNGVNFSKYDTFNIQLVTADLNVAGIAIQPTPKSPIADYVYYWYQRNTVTQTSGLGEVKTGAQNASNATAAHKMSRAYNSMVHKTLLLGEFLYVNSSVYPEFVNHYGSKEFRGLTTLINAYNI